MTRAPGDHLYARVLGSAWHELAPPVRAVHSPGAETRGEFHIVHGPRRIAAMLARWSGLPRPAARASTQLRIVDDGTRQRWERTFDGRPFITTQWAGVPGCLLMERIGSWEIAFRLRVSDDGALHYEQTRARFRLGPLRLPLPFSPRVTASETPESPARVSISVQVRLLLVGQLIAYHGWLAVEPPESSSSLPSSL